MRLICFWCAVLALAHAQESYYAPQTFTNNVRGGINKLARHQVTPYRPNRLVADASAGAGLFQPMHRPWNTLMRIPNRLDQYQKEMFVPSPRNDVTPQGSIESWRPAPAPVREPWREPVSFNQGPALPRPEPWRAPFQHQITKEQQAAILHHKQALTREGAFRFEYASDNGLAAGEVIEPDGSRVGAYQYKDPSGQLVKLKYRAGKDGFQILEGSHLPKSPEPVPPPTQDNHYVQAYEEQRRQYELQQQYNQQKNEPQQGGAGGEEGRDGRPSGGQYYVQSWRPGQEDDGQYRENEVESAQNRGPHTFGEGYAFSFQG